MLTHFLHAGHVGAVTGNPRIRNRSTVLGRMQVGEFLVHRGADQAHPAALRQADDRLRS